MTMEVEDENSIVETLPSNVNPDVELDKDLLIILNHLTDQDEICFKSQQRGEADLTKEEKIKIGVDIYNKSKLNFLTRFGKYLRLEDLKHFTQFTTNTSDEHYEVNLILKEFISNLKSKNVKNRRYEALLELIAENEYFSEVEMMKRNPLLYEQLVGQYLSEEEIKERDKYKMEEETSFVKILMEGIERNDAEERRQNDESKEDDAAEEEDSDDESAENIPTTSSHWGEYASENKKIEKGKQKAQMRNKLNITAEERKLLKEEFITTMYQSFLYGSDKDFDYSIVDSNAKYDNMDIIMHDEEEKYFDDEEPENDQNVNKKSNETSEDELDIFMSALDENTKVKELSATFKNISTNE